MSLSWEVRARSPILFFHEYCMTASAALDGPEMNVFLPVCVERAPLCPPPSPTPDTVISRRSKIGRVGQTPFQCLYHICTQLCSVTID